MRILGLDIGEKRIGVAISDELKLTAQGLETIRREDLASTLKNIKKLTEEYSVEKIIVGLPLNMNGSKGKSACAIEEFARHLEKEIPVSVDMIDERLTTAEGERLLLTADVSRAKRKLSIDKIAAQLILQSYLDSHAKENKS